MIFLHALLIYFYIKSLILYNFQLVTCLYFSIEVGSLVFYFQAKLPSRIDFFIVSLWIRSFLIILNSHLYRVLFLEIEEFHSFSYR